MKTVNNSSSKPYYTQRNNELNPIKACNVTSIIIALVTAGWPCPSGKYKQKEDNLMSFFLNDPTILMEWEKIDPRQVTPPNEWYTLLARGTNLWLKNMNGPKIELTWLLNLSKYKSVIDNGGAVVFSGKFETQRNRINHMFAGVGYKASGSSVKSLIVDDPYGDYRDKYKTVKGNDVEMPIDDFLQKGFPYGNPNKLGIIVPKYVRGE